LRVCWIAARAQYGPELRLWLPLVNGVKFQTETLPARQAIELPIARMWSTGRTALSAPTTEVEHAFSGSIPIPSANDTKLPCLIKCSVD
jgi:hypothetical protein